MVTVKKVNRNVRSMASDHAETVIRTLVGILTSVKAQDSARVAAGKELLDRGYGKAVSSLELTGRDGGAMEVKEMSQGEKERRFPEFFADMMAAGQSEDDSDEKDESASD
jgi:hypothetical protein